MGTHAGLERATNGGREPFLSLLIAVCPQPHECWRGGRGAQGVRVVSGGTQKPSRKKVEPAKRWIAYSNLANEINSLHIFAPNFSTGRAKKTSRNRQKNEIGC